MSQSLLLQHQSSLLLLRNLMAVPLLPPVKQPKPLAKLSRPRKPKVLRKLRPRRRP
jgi:hypothetical protein